MSLLALIPARGGSKGRPRKHIRLFCGKPLIQWSIDVARAAPSVDRVVVSTDDPEIAEIASAAGAEVPFLRPSEFACDTAPGIAPVLHALQQLPDVSDLLLMQPTSPLREIADVEAIIGLRQETCGHTVVSVTPTSKHPAWMYTLTPQQVIKPLLDTPDASCRQDLQPAYVLNGALYLSSRVLLEQNKSFLTKNTVAYAMPPERSVDIDTLFDWHWGEFLMQQKLLIDSQ